MTRFGQLLRRLVASKVELIVVGGIAGVAHGAARATCRTKVPGTKDLGTKD